MKSFINALLFCFVVFMLTSCKKDNPVDTSPSVKQIWPLKPGNTWAFSTIGYDTTGAVKDSGSGAFVVTTDTIVDGETWYHMTGLGSTLLTNRSDGFWGMPKSVPGLIFKYPASAGDSWNYGDQYIFLQSADTSITVQAGTYHCYKYRFSTDVYYLCPGVGIIAQDSYLSTNSGRLYIESRLSVTSVTLK